MTLLPEKVRVTHVGWNKNRGAYKAQIGDSNRTIAYAWVPGSHPDAHAEVMAIATRICEGWNA